MEEYFEKTPVVPAVTVYSSKNINFIKVYQQRLGL